MTLFAAPAGADTDGTVTPDSGTITTGGPGRPGRDPWSGVTCTGSPINSIGTGGSGPITFKRGEENWVIGDLQCSNGFRTGAYCYSNCAPGSPPVRPTVDSAIRFLPLPYPTPRLSPPLDKVRAGNIGGYLPGLYLFAAIPPAAWTPVTVTVTQQPPGPDQITLTATPRILHFKVGNETHSCVGPGPIVVDNDTYTAAKASSGCRHLFTTRGDYPSEVWITYSITWTSTFVIQPDNALSGTRPDRTGPPISLVLPVREVQAVGR